MNWLKQMFGRTGPIIGMAHLPPLPGTPEYDGSLGVEGIVEHVARDVAALQAGGVDAIMFGNEGDRPYLLKVGPEVIATMARVVTQLRPDVKVPFGVDVLWDPEAALAVAKATGALFVREIFTGVFASDMGIWQPNAGAALRYRRSIDAGNVRCFFNINAEFAHPLDARPLARIARSVVFSSLADAICVSGPMTGESVATSHLEEVKTAIPETPVIANTGVRADNVAQVLRVADAVIVGTSLKRDGITWNPVDPERVKRFVAAARGA